MKLSSDDISKIIKEYGNGGKVSDIAKTYNISGKHVYYIVNKYSPFLIKRKPPFFITSNIPVHIIQNIVKGYKQGLKINYIAHSNGVSEPMVRKILKQYAPELF